MVYFSLVRDVDEKGSFGLYLPDGELPRLVMTDIYIYTWDDIIKKIKEKYDKIETEVEMHSPSFGTFGKVVIKFDRPLTNEEIQKIVDMEPEDFSFWLFYFDEGKVAIDINIFVSDENFSKLEDYFLTKDYIDYY